MTQFQMTKGRIKDNTEESHGVYKLYNQSRGSGIWVGKDPEYVGRARNVRKRLLQHNRNSGYTHAWVSHVDNEAQAYRKEAKFFHEHSDEKKSMDEESSGKHD